MTPALAAGLALMAGFGLGALAVWLRLGPELDRLRQRMVAMHDGDRARAMRYIETGLRALR